MSLCAKDKRHLTAVHYLSDFEITFRGRDRTPECDRRARFIDAEGAAADEAATSIRPIYHRFFPSDIGRRLPPPCSVPFSGRVFASASPLRSFNTPLRPSSCALFHYVTRRGLFTRGLHFFVPIPSHSHKTFPTSIPNATHFRSHPVEFSNLKFQFHPTKIPASQKLYSVIQTAALIICDMHKTL